MDVSEDVLGVVLERVGSHVTLIRAAAVCRRWRRAVADAAFLRRFRSLHAPPVAGYYHNGSTSPNFLMRRTPAFLPSSPSMVDARHFALDFLPDGCWNVVDSRGSLLLMVRQNALKFNSMGEMLVCEPLTRCYMMVTPMPDFDGSCYILASFLIDGITDKAGGCIGMSNFRVLCMLHRGEHRHAAVFTKGGESGSTTWSEKSIDCTPVLSQIMLSLGHAGGSWYFYVEHGILIILDGSTGEFSQSQLPIAVYQDLNMLAYNYFHIMEGRDGKPRLFTAFGDSIKVFMRLGSGDWVLEKRFLLSVATSSLPGYHPSFFSQPPNVLTRGVGFITLSPRLERRWSISIDLETMEASPAAGDMGDMVYRCELPWPPALHALQ